MTTERIVVQVIAPDVQIYRAQVYGEHNNLVTPYDIFKASNFATDVISGANNYTSGYNFLSGTLSNVVRIRPINISFQNRETGAMTIVFRDGSITGAIVAGPFIVNATQDRSVVGDALLGRFFQSSIYAVVLSGTFGQGIVTTIGYVLDEQAID